MFATFGEGLVPVLIIAFLYFIPSMTAWVRSHHQLGPIVVVNVLLGWTFVGWVVALAMACSAVKRPETQDAPPAQG